MSEATHLQALLDDRLAEIRRQVTENRRVRAANEELRKALDQMALERDRARQVLLRLVNRCDTTELADGSSICTLEAHALLHPDPDLETDLDPEDDRE
jgi:regulator of replication initiation timing